MTIKRKSASPSLLPAMLDPAPRRTGFSSLMALWTFAVLGVMMPAFLVAATEPASSMLWPLPMLVVLISAARLSCIIASGTRRLFEMVFWTYICAFLGLAPMVQLREGIWPHLTPRIDPHTVLPALIIVLVGIAAFLVGIAAHARWAVRPVQQRVPQEKKYYTINRRRLLILTAFAVLFNMYYLAHVGFIQFLKTRADAYEDYDVVWVPGSLGMMVRACSYMSLLVCFVALVRWRREMKVALASGWDVVSQRWLQVNLALCIGVGILLANSMNPISNARYLSGTAMLAAAVALGLCARTLWYRMFVYAFCFAMLVIYPLSDAFRYNQAPDFDFSGLVDTLLSPDFDSFTQIANGYLVATRDGVEVGRQFLGVFVFWFPRALWDGKPADTAIVIGESRGYKFTNLSAPLFIELFMNGGWIVLILGMFAFGFAMHAWDNRIDSDLEIYRTPSPMAAIFPFYMMILLRGSLLQATPYVAFILAFALFIRQRPPKPTGGLGSDVRRTRGSPRRSPDTNGVEPVDQEPSSRRQRTAGPVRTPVPETVQARS